MKLIYKSATFITLFLAVFLFNSCDDDRYQTDWSLAEEHLYDISGVSESETESGVTYYVIEEGSGSYTVERRSQIRVFFTARILRNMDIIESSYRDRSTTPTIIADIGSRNSQTAHYKTEGLKEGVKGMKEGEKRVLIVPPELGHGVSEDGEGDTLRYDIELVEIVR